MALNTEWAQVEVIDLINDGSGLGFEIIGDRSTGVVVQTILPGGVADRDKRLQIGDHILQTGEVNLRGMDSKQVAAVLRLSGSHVRLMVARPVESTSPDYQAQGSHAPIVPTKLLGEPDELDRHLLQNGYPETFNPHTAVVDTYDNHFICSQLDSETELHPEPNLVVDVVRNPLPVEAAPILMTTPSLPVITMDMMPLETPLPETEKFTVELKKGYHGLGIRPAGHVCEKEKRPGIFVKNINEGSAADLCKKIQLNDRIVEKADQAAERLPDTEEEQPEFYEKEKGTAQIHGQIFEYKFCALSFLRTKNKGYNFKLACNVKGYGKFDDVVVEFLNENNRKSHIFLQLKSKVGYKILHNKPQAEVLRGQKCGRTLPEEEEGPKIKMQQLLEATGDFSLRKYYESYIEIEEKFTCSEGGDKMESKNDERLFIIYTNAAVEQKLKSNKVIDVSQADFLMTGGSVLQFNEEDHKAIYKHLQKLPKHREFLSRFRIFYSQANEEEMDWHIKRELQQSMKLPESELDLTYTVYLPIIQNWWQNCNYFLKEANSKENDPLRKTSEKLRSSLVAKVLDQRKSELDGIGIKYKQSAITYMKELIESDKAVLIFAPGRSTTPTAAKIYQMLSGTEHIILNLQQLIRYKPEVMFAWKSRFDVLVLESQRSTENLQDIFNEISIILKECAGEKRFFFIVDAGGNIEQISAIRRTFGTKLREEHDGWKLTDIITESRKFILEKKVNFQGSVIPIKNIVNNRDVHMFDALDLDSMSLLLANEKPAIGVPVAKTLKYYIDRSLERKKKVELGSQNESKVLIHSGESTLEVLQCTSTYREKNCNIGDYEQYNHYQSLPKKNEQETTEVSNETHKMQRLCKQDEQHHWERNADDLGSAHQNLIWRPKTLLDGEDRIILVTGEPGTGKSTLLTHFAKQARERNPDVWIVRVNINNYTSILREIKTNGFDERSAIKLIMEAAKVKESNSVQLEKKLFNYVCNSTGNMAVMIDGVDEVSPHYTAEVIEILRILLKTQIRKIWVTSRNSLKDLLEQEFQCQSYTLVPFSVEDQKSFLVKFWKQKVSNTQADILNNLANRVTELSSKLLSVRETNFMGIPLQSMLLAEVFEEKLNQCSTSRTVESPEHINLFMLYDLYVNKKWDIYLSEKKLSDSTNVNMVTDDDILYDMFIENHKAAALMAILSTQQLEKLNDKDLLKKGAEFFQKIDKGLEKTGIITDIIEGRPVFLHRTFAEYFVARRLCDNVLASQVFMRDHLFESEFGVVRSMVDRILANKCPLHQAVLNSNTRYIARLLKTKESITQKDLGGRTPLHVAISCRSSELTSLFLEHEADVSSVDTFLGLSSLQYANRIDDCEMLSLLLEKRPLIRERVLNAMKDVGMKQDFSVFVAAAKYGHTDLLRYLISMKNCVNMALSVDGGTLIHEAAGGNHIQTVRTLVDLGGNCDNQDAKGKTALHVAAETGSLEVAKFIVERQEMSYAEAESKNIMTLNRAITKLNRLNVRDNDGNTPLHLSAVAGNTSTVRYLLNAGSDLRSCNTCGEYPLALAARYGRIDTVNLLLQSCSDEKCEEIVTSTLKAAIEAGQVDTTALILGSGAPVSGGENEGLIHVASRMGHKEIVILLLQYGSSLTSRTDIGNTPLHSASEAGHLSLVMYLVKLQRDGMYSLNYEKETPMHLAARNGRDYIVKYFAERGCNINAESANGSTCLHLACENGHYTTVEYLLKHGAEVNEMNSADQSPLHIAASRGQTKILELLSKHNANFSLSDKEGITALLAASMNGHQDTVRFILQHGGNIEDTDGKGNGIAHFAVANENCDILKYLSKHAANLEVQNYDGDTPLLKAVREGRKRVVHYLAAKLSDINEKGKDGMRPLDVAVLRGDMEITRLLLEQNARSVKKDMHIVAAARFGFLDLMQHFVSMGDDINVKADNGESPIHAACEFGQVATVQYLCDHGALLDLQDNNGNTALHVAVSKGHLEVTRVLVQKGANLCAADASDSTALHIAAKSGYLNIVKYLADSFAPIDMRNARKETALLVAAAEGHKKIIRFLIEQGAGIGVRDIEGKTALEIATVKGHTAIIQVLKNRAEGKKLVFSITHIDLNSDSEVGNGEHLHLINALACASTERGRNGNYDSRMLKTTAEDTLEVHSDPRSALHTAAVNGNLEDVQRLVEAGTAVDYCDNFGRTALWTAAQRGHKSIIRFLLENGSCVNIADCEGLTPIEIAARERYWHAVDEVLEHDPVIRPEGIEYLKNQLYEASETGDLETMRIILNCGINVDTTNQNGYTPLHVAAKYGQIEITRILLKSGASVNTADSYGKTPMNLAAVNGHIEIIRQLLAAEAISDCSKSLYLAATSGHVEVVRELLNCCESVNNRNEDGFTPLRSAAANGHVQVIKELLNHGAEVDIRDNYGDTPFSAAALNGHVEVMRELLNNAANVNNKDNKGATPLQVATERDHLEFIRELLNHDASVDLADKNGCTPLRVGAEKGHVEVVRELLNHGASMDLADEEGWKPFRIAAEKGHVEVVREFLNHGVSVDLPDKDGWTTLRVAADKGHVEVVREILNHGASVELADKDGWTPLRVAAEKGYVEVVQELLNHGASADLVDKAGWTPLRVAAQKGHEEVVRKFLNHDSSVNLAYKYGPTPLLVAAENGHVEVVRELLNHGASVDLPDKDGLTTIRVTAEKGDVEVVREMLSYGASVDLADKDCWTPLRVAAGNGHVEVVRELLNRGASVDLVYRYGPTPLRVAAEKGHVEVVRELLNHGASMDLADKDGWTPFLVAADNGHVEVVRELINHGGSVDLANEFDWSPLRVAAEKGHVEVVRELLNHGASVDLASKFVLTILGVAAEKGHVEFARELLNHGASVDLASKYGWTPLLVAAENGHVEVVRELLNHGASVNLSYNDGRTPLLRAAQKGHVDVIRELLNHGASVDLASKYGWTPLLVAAENGHVDVFRELLNHGASVDLSYKDGWTPLRRAAQKGHVDVVRELLKHGATVVLESKYSGTPLRVAAENGFVEVVRELLNNGASVDLADKDGWTPLRVAAERRHVEVVRELLNHGASVDLADKDGWTLLRRAAEKGHVEVVRELLNHGASADLADKDGWTPLRIAADKRHVEVVRELLNHGASVDLAGKDGWTPLCVAAEKRQVEVVRELLNHRASMDLGDKNVWKIFRKAAENGHVEVVREFLNHGAGVDLADKDGWTPLRKAAENGHVEVVREFLNHGAGVDLADEYGLTLLSVAARDGQVEVIREFLNHGVSVNLPYKYGPIPLFVAATNGHVEVVRELINHGASVDLEYENYGTPLLLAAGNGHVEVVRELLNHCACVELADMFGSTPLFKAAMEGHVEVVRELLNHCASVDVAHAMCMTPLSIAVERGHVEVVRELLNHGASVDLADKDGRTHLRVAAANGLVEVVRELLNHCASVDLEDNNGLTPLHVAVDYDHLEVVRELLNHGASLDLGDKNGWKLFRKAAKKGDVEIVRKLLNHGASVDLADKDGWTPLRVAAEIGHVEVVRELLNHGASVDLADKDGWTPLRVAAEIGHAEVFLELLNHGASVDLENIHVINFCKWLNIKVT